MKEIAPKLNEEDKILMEKLLAAGHIEYKYARRLQIVLRRAQKKSAHAIAEAYSAGRSAVSVIVKRYNSGGLQSLLHDKTRKPGKAPISNDIKNRMCEAACHEKPKNAAH
jgi:hypothetical protein